MYLQYVGKREVKTVFDLIFYELKPQITAHTEISDRQIKHIALLLTPIMLLQNKLEFPFDFSGYKQSVIDNTIKQNEMANTIKNL